ncbi:hypothetical protein B0I35DRAFT_437993 [Stachybotrys elegans]|uniref:GPI inositol-deacylase winged helix domain-containing protein n=1 Tax=Stachybotrys elegans TaxID=80388 RepID=A0A8K0SPB4_9HYPO|nr:hypothetical protein B0I35DRAFT_437993 [Stachybotrys elegans]
MLKAIPEGLNSLYHRMLTGALTSVDSALCRDILPLVCISSRPLTLQELSALVPGLTDLSESDLRGVFTNCGSFLSVQSSNSGLVILTFVHESAREFLTEAAQQTLFPSGIAQQHRVVLKQALRNIKELRRNIFNLAFPAVRVEEIVYPDPDPLAKLRYSCLHWLDHAGYLQQHDEWQSSEDEVLTSLIRHDLLHWLEVLGLTGGLPQGTAGFQRLSKFYRKRPGPGSERLRDLVDSARRFILYNKTCIETVPLQVYASALLFYGHGGNDEIERCYRHELDWVTLYPKSSSITWEQLAQKFSSGYVPMSMAFSPDGELLVTGNSKYIVKDDSYEYCVEIWDVMASHRIQYIQMDTSVTAVTFCSDGKRICVILSSGVVQMLEVGSGLCIGGFTHHRPITEASFSPNSKLAALHMPQFYCEIVKADSGDVVQSIDGVKSLRFSPDSQRAVTRLSGDRVALWLIGSTTPLWTVSIPARHLCFFGGHNIAVRCWKDIITIRSVADGTEITSWPCHSSAGSMVWLRKGYSHLSWCGIDEMKVYDETGKLCIQSLPTTVEFQLSSQCEGDSLAYSIFTHSLAWAGDSWIWYWDLQMSRPEFIHDNTPEASSRRATELLFSADDTGYTQLAALIGSRIQLRRLRDGEVIDTHVDSRPISPEYAFSPDGKKLAVWDYGHFWVRDTRTGATTPEEHIVQLRGPLSFSPDSHYVALPCGDSGVQLWDLEEQKVTHTIAQPASIVAFSHDNQRLAIAYCGHIEVWTVSPLERTHTMDVDYDPLREDRASTNFMLAAFSPDDQLLAIATYGCVSVWALGDTEPRWEFPWNSDDMSQHRSIALSSDHSKVAVTYDFRVWVWYLGYADTTQALYIEIPHKTRSCRFSADGKRLLVNGGAVLIPSLTDENDEELKRAQDEITYQGLGLSDDCVWITKDGDKVLYLPEEYRPQDHPRESWSGEIAFTESMVAIGTGRIHILRFL